MARIRLTNPQRDKIAKEVVNRALKDRRDNLNRRRLADLVYWDLYTVEQVAAMGKMPEGFLPESTGVKVSFEGLTRNGYQYVYWDGSRRLAHDHQQHVARVYHASHDLNVHARLLDGEEKDLKKLADDLTQEAQAVLKNCYSLSALLKKWPEVAEFTQFIKPPEQMPMVPIDDLNRRLGLTQEKQA